MIVSGTRKMYTVRLLRIVYILGMLGIDGIVLFTLACKGGTTPFKTLSYNDLCADKIAQAKSKVVSGLSFNFTPANVAV